MSLPHPKGTCSASLHGVGILIHNLGKERRLPRQSADWLAMTNFFAGLSPLRRRRDGYVIPV